MLYFYLKQVMVSVSMAFAWHYSQWFIFYTILLSTSTFNVVYFFTTSLIFIYKVVFEYPEAKMTSEQQISSLGETFQELLKRLDDGISSVIYLCSFMSGLDFYDFRFSTVLVACYVCILDYILFLNLVFVCSEFLEWKTAEGRKRFIGEAGCSEIFFFFLSLQTIV